MIIASAGFLWFTWLTEKLNHHNVHVAHGVLVFLTIFISSLLYKLSLKSVEEEIIPTGKFNLKNILQSAVGSLSNFVGGVIKDHPEQYFPLLSAVFIYIFLSNLMGVLPGFLPPTESISTNLAVGITIYFYYHYVGVKAQGFKNYFAHFIGPSVGEGLMFQLMRFGFLAPLMFVIELISHSVRPISLSMRLFGNINGDHIVLTTFADLVPLGVPVLFLAFGIFVSFLQAFVFTLLSAIYIAMAVEVHGDHHHEAHH